MRQHKLPQLLAAILLSYLAVPLTAEARYVPIPLNDLIGKSDLVVLATIQEVRPESFVVRVEELLATQLPTPTGKIISLEIQRFAEWPEAQRWAPYEKGQRSVFCLAQNAKSAPFPYRVRSAGNEGELPVQDGQVHYIGQELKLKTETYTVHGHKLAAKRFSWKIFEGMVARMTRKAAEKNQKG